jgi:hypothetical protein
MICATSSHITLPLRDSQCLVMKPPAYPLSRGDKPGRSVGDEEKSAAATRVRGHGPIRDAAAFTPSGPASMLAAGAISLPLM